MKIAYFGFLTGEEFAERISTGLNKICKHKSHINKVKIFIVQRPAYSAFIVTNYEITGPNAQSIILLN